MTESKWIPVSERKPDNARTVWLAVEGKKEAVRGCCLGDFYRDIGGWVKSPVTHWQEIAEEPPAPPKRVRRVEVEAATVVRYSSKPYATEGIYSVNVLLPPDATNITVSYDTEE